MKISGSILLLLGRNFQFTENPKDFWDKKHLSSGIPELVNISKVIYLCQLQRWLYHKGDKNNDGADVTGEGPSGVSHRAFAEQMAVCHHGHYFYNLNKIEYMLTKSVIP